MKETKKTILNAGIRLFKNSGFTQTSVVDICDACNITKGTFYYHYKSKDDLLVDYYETLSLDTLKIAKELINENSYLMQLWKMFEHMIDWENELGPELTKHLIMIDIERECGLFTPYASLRRRNSKEYVDLALEITKKGQASGEIRSNADPEELYFAQLAGSFAILKNWAATNGKLNLKKEIYRLFETVFLP